MSGKFELYTDNAGKFRFRLKASNGQVIASSQGYVSRKSALDGIASVRNNAPEAPIVEVEE
ncbi:MAG: YegP family protein [Candidatus Nanopelagicales bacterium]